MLYIEGNTIKLTRGDTAYIEAPLSTADGAYEMNGADTLTLTVKKNVRTKEHIFQKSLIGTNIFHIEPVDTAEVAFGKYTYDIQLTTNIGDVFTVVPPSTFEVLAEVTW